jgi:hypothetical protein
MRNEKSKLMVIHSQRLAGFLMMNGFRLIKLLFDESSSLNKFIFINSPALIDCMENWQIQKLKELDREKC